MDPLVEIRHKLEALSNPQKAELHKMFIQAVEGGYGYGDKILGVSVPEQRQIAKLYSKDIELTQVERLLREDVHEFRLTALLILVEIYKKTKDIETKSTIVSIYLKNTDRINNWNLVDSSADKIIGAYFFEMGRTDELDALASKGTLWEQRIAVVATLYNIRKGEFQTSFKICETLLNHPHHLIHKALGWILREIGKKDFDALYHYLTKNYRMMPRVMLRYAIEKYSPELRAKFLKGVI